MDPIPNWLTRWNAYVRGLFLDAGCDDLLCFPHIQTVCELEQLFASGDARPDQYKVGCYYRQRTWWPDDPERIHRNLLNRRDRSLSWW